MSQTLAGGSPAGILTADLARFSLTGRMPVFHLALDHGLLLSSNYELYGDMSARVREVLEECSAGLEPYSIDKMFVRFDGFDAASTEALARMLYRNVRELQGTPCMLLDLVEANLEQLSLLDTPEREAQRDRDHQLMAALDELNGKMGKVRLGVPRQNAAWHLRCAHRTPRWTTQWREQRKVKA
ncbi:DUF4113 domain-containing protein [Onishia niordana]|uniref:DUF4113 domain-containing protein n=1 Tax=Onishia niordana TaxID=2508711 RepID=UPI0023EF50AF|nr:DUF4113 domain-containing protein [Halomonas niordiana]